MKKNLLHFQLGFTITEMAIVLGMSAILFGIATINLSVIVPKGNVTTTIDVLQTDLRQQQAKVMLGDTEARTTNSRYGVHFESDKYILFYGDEYLASDSANFVVQLPDSLEILTTFPSSRVVFEKGSGEILNYNEASNQITIRDTSFTVARVMTLNRYGVITSVVE